MTSDFKILRMRKILVTGGTGYIGSHTAVQLLQLGYDVVIADNLANSSIKVVSLIEQITGKKPQFFKTELCNAADVEFLFKNNKFDAIIHFAALKSAPESVKKPFLYHYNNITSLLNLIEAAKKYKVKNLIFSSSCAVYGLPSYLPVDENHPFNTALSPYARTKQIGEFILQDIADKKLRVISLRYFNPIGAHPSGLLGDMPEKSANLMHYILQVALGQQPYLKIYGNDYNTPDGTGVRDYIHIMDVADAHIAALERLLNNKMETPFEAYNIGIGEGISVLQMVKAFEKYTGIKIPFKFVQRRPGDVDYIYASTDLANKKLGWKAKYELKDMIITSWKWAKNLNSVFYEFAHN